MRTTKKWVASLVVAVLTIVLGIIIVANPFETSKKAFQIFGILLIVSGVLNIYNGGITKRYFKKSREQLELQKEKEETEYIDIQ